MGTHCPYCGCSNTSGDEDMANETHAQRKAADRADLRLRLGRNWTVVKMTPDATVATDKFEEVPNLLPMNEHQAIKMASDMNRTAAFYVAASTEYFAHQIGTDL